MRKPVGIKDVADRAGVSITTVSHVLSDRRPVAQSTRTRVLATIEELGYRPNAVAQSLITQRTRTIALVVPDITNPFYPALARGMLDVLGESGYAAVICNTDGRPEEEERLIGQMLARRVDALGFAGYREYDGQLQPAVDAGLPVVAFGLKNALPGVDAVGIDDLSGGRRATEYLLASGRSRIAFLAGPEREGQRHDRITGYQLALSGWGGSRPAPESIIHAELSRADGARAFRELIARGAAPDGIVCINDVVALGVYDGAREAGLSVPGDIAVVGFDDIEVASLVSPSLTTMRVPAREEGRAGAELLLARLASGSGQPPRSIQFASTLVRRESA